MTRKFWGIIMIGSLLVVIGSAAYLYRAIQNKPFQSVPLAPAAAAAGALPAISTGTAAIPGSAALPAPAENGNPSASSAALALSSPTVSASNGVGDISDKNIFSPHQNPRRKTRPGFKSVTFIYQPPARSVYLVGSFNHWFRKPLKKTITGMWAITLDLRPGTYQYLFVVNGKRSLDPAPDAILSDDGNTSIITVKQKS
jgi:hypothetical protein